MLTNATKNVLYIKFMGELGKILIIFSVKETVQSNMHIQRGFALLPQC